MDDGTSTGSFTLKAGESMLFRLEDGIEWSVTETTKFPEKEDEYWDTVFTVDGVQMGFRNRTYCLRYHVCQWQCSGCLYQHLHHAHWHACRAQER